MSTNTVWSPGSPNIPNGQIKIAPTPSGTTSNNIQTDWTSLNVNSTNSAVKNLEYRINDLNVVEFRYPTTSDPNGPKTTANSIQEVADDKLYVAAYGYTPQTTALIKDSLQRELTAKADSVNWKAPAPPGPPGPDQQAAIPTGKTETVPSIETVTVGKQLKIAPDSGLTYPLNRKSTQDRIKFQAYKILPRTGQSQASSGINLDFRFGQRNYESVDGPVFLAIQAGISDQNSVDWGPDSVNAIDAALYNASINLMQTDTGQELGKKVGDLAGQIQGKLREVGGKFGRYLAGQAAGINNVLARTDNIILNPNLELLFQGPQLRPFTFQFKMSAREKPEAEQVKKIIKYFKYHMAVRQETTGLFLKAPNVFEIEYQYGTSTPHPGLNLIKKCALTNCSVDYTPLGTYATYEDGTMVAYTLSLQFQELEPIYDVNYTDAQPIGY